MNNNDHKNEYDFFDETPYTYGNDNNLYRVVNNKYSDVKHKTLKISIIVGVITLLIGLLLTVLIVGISRDRLEKEYSEMLTTYKSDLVKEIMKNLDYKYEVSGGNMSIGTYIANIMMDSVVEVYCYESASSTSYSATATALLINDEGYMVTNAHVVTYESRSFFQNKVITNKYAKIQCKFKGRSDMHAVSVLSYDTDIDLALIKFDELPGEGVNSVTFALSDSLLIGETAIAIGNAEGLGISLTTGVVSNSVQQYDGVDYIQTDCAINPGNSGGPLYNGAGYCIGVVTSKMANSNNEGLGFAITADLVIDYIEEYNSAHGVSVKYSVI